MRLSGTLRSWDDDRGFGFIAPTHGGAELFVHISALPKDGSRPTVGEKLSYELGRGKSGKPQATNVRRQAIGEYSRPAGVHRPEPKRRRSPIPLLVSLLLLLVLGVYAFTRYGSGASVSAARSELFDITQRQDTVPESTTSGFNCDGRTRCTQMTSCREAKLFLKHCPGVEMDGNHDGTPCEQQWCTGIFAK